MTDERMPLGVFASSGAGLGAAIDKVLDLGVTTVQTHAPGASGRTKARAEEIAGQFADAGITVSLVFCGYAGESYKSIQIVKDTVGLVPPATRAERVQETKEIADFAAWMGAPGIGIHVGAVSEDWGSQDFSDMAGVIGDVADHCGSLGLIMNLETGQETADTLLHLLETVDRPNLGVNFDPANMILYGAGEPLEAVRKVGAYVKSCHCKDGTWSAEPGVTWGLETPLGEGDVDIAAFIATLHELGYEGPLTIEREISGAKQIEDIKAGIELLRRIKADLGLA